MIAPNSNESHDGELEGVKLMRAKALVRCLSVSVRQTHRLNRAGLLPTPLRIGGVVRWREDEISRWLQCGAPPRSEWEQRTDNARVPEATRTAQ